MAGHQGQIQARSRKGTGRRKLWSSIRILRTFTLPDLMRTADAKESNARKYVLRLAVHGYVREVVEGQRGMKGGHKTWSISINPGPDHPIVCQNCGSQLSAGSCDRMGDHREAAND